MNDPAITTSHVKSNVFAGVKSSINSNLFMVFGMNESLKRPSTKQQQQHYHSGVPIMCWSTILWMLAANTKFSRQKLNPKWRERLWISMIQLKMNSFIFCNCQWNRYHDGFFFQWWENWSYGWLGKDRIKMNF